MRYAAEVGCSRFDQLRFCYMQKHVTVQRRFTFVPMQNASGTATVETRVLQVISQVL